jgi:GDPmannose 4,6-dehydratase
MSSGSRHALIFGAHGQDGRLLSALLEREGCALTKVGRGDLTVISRTEIHRLLPSGQPCEIYHLAAEHGPAEARGETISAEELLRRSFETHALLTGTVLETVRERGLGDRVFFASSSRVFGNPATSPQTETTPTSPACIYGMTKETGMRLCRMYREKHGVHASVGILYNHESNLRQPGFVSRKIVDGVLRARQGDKAPLVLKSLDDRVDWSSALDAVRAIVAIVRCESPRDYVVASGVLHSLREFVTIAFDEAGLAWQDHVRVDGSLPVARRPPLVGDTTLLRTATGWSPTVTFEEMVRGLVRSAMHDGCG